MKKILFPTDFSEAANQAFAYALRLANALGASITTLHTYSKPDLASTHLSNTLVEVYNSIEMEEFENYKSSVPLLRKIAENINLDQVPVHHVMKEGKTIETILAFSKQDDFDLIVTGTRGSRGLMEIFAGSVSGELLENANCPVLVVPVAAEFDGRMDNIAVTTEFKEEDKELVAQLQPIAQKLDAHVKLYLVNVDLAHVEPYTQRMAKWKEEFKQYDNMEFEVLDALSMEKAIKRFIAEKKIDMLVMLTHKRGFIKEFFNYSITKRLAYHLNTPILAFQAHNL